VSIAIPAIERVLFTEEQIDQRIRELAAEISRDYRGKTVKLIGVLKGSVFFLTELARRLEVPVQVDFLAISSFWVAEFLALGGGSLAEAQRVFDAACAYANDVGLFAEEIAPHTGEALGNFPQAYTHVGLINAALSIAKRARERRAA